MSSKTQAVVAGVLVTVLLFILGLFDSSSADSVVLVVGYGLVGIAVLAWIAVVGSEVFSQRS
jgi:threonine dehydrogenase-like Zn-dependent dehydrogenase